MATPAGAQSVDYAHEAPIPTVREAPGWTVGLGVGAAPDYEGSDDYEAVPIPHVHWQSESARFFDLTGLKARANVLAHDMLQVGPLLQIRGERDDVEDDRVDDLKSVDTAVELGAFVGVVLGNFSAELDGQVDVADGHDGWLIGLRGNYGLPLAPSWLLGLGASTTYASDDYMESYFGIDAADSARSGLDTFDADAGLKDVGGDVSLTYTGFGNWAVSGLLSYKRLLDDAEDSPVTDDRGSANQAFGGVLVTYKF